MDASTLDHSDSDSGESWTLLEHGPYCADDVPQFPDQPVQLEGDMTEKENSDKDEDTDGISIISDSDPENVTPYEQLSYYYNLSDSEDRPVECNINQNYLAVPNTSNIANDRNESMRCDDDFLNDSSGKLKTYVHKRNKKLSTVLNIIVLGSVITAAGVAIGHMWGVRDDCSTHSASSVNKILSNLYKLQEENAFLRNKIKELTFANNWQLQQRKSDAVKVASKQLKCKKVFEESLHNKDALISTKCVDTDADSSPEVYTNDDLFSDIHKAKYSYKQNKIWLDCDENKVGCTKKMEISSPSNTDKGNIDERNIKDINLKLQLQVPTKSTPQNENEGVEANDKIYSDAPKSSDNKVKTDEMNDDGSKDRISNKRIKREDDVLSESSASDTEAKKEDRYTDHKQKQEKKAYYNRLKIHKKQKRKNKYEQWEMKGGYIKDYDDISSSSNENYYLPESTEKYSFGKVRERINYILNYMNLFPKHGASMNTKQSVESAMEDDSEDINCNANENQSKEDHKVTWQQHRADLRKEARKNLNRDIFGENSRNSARWYFRRMQRREQSRAKGETITPSKFSKRNKNP